MLKLLYGTTDANKETLFLRVKILLTNFVNKWNYNVKCFLTLHVIFI